MNRPNRSIAALMLVTVLAACADAQDKPKETVGTLLGAGLGALAGSQFGGGKGKYIATAIGTLAGAYFGSEIGKSLDKADREAAQRATQQALENNPSGQTQTWNNPDSGNRGTVTPTKTFETAEGQPCREFETTVIVDGREETAYGTACRQADGSWRITG